MVYGFTKQSGGMAQVSSKLGVGTTVSLLFPIAQGEQPDETDRVPEAPASGSETILVVEDDETVRVYAEEALRELGYTVLVAANGASALMTIASNPAVDLLFTDVVLPGGMTGRQLATMAKAGRPGLRVLFTSGYARNALETNRRLDPDVDLLGKPYTFSELALRIRAALVKPG
jgi:CheY-like chemotaxis protein